MSTWRRPADGAALVVSVKVGVAAASACAPADVVADTAYPSERRGLTPGPAAVGPVEAASPMTAAQCPPTSGAIILAIRLCRPVRRSSASASVIARSPALTPSQRSGSGSQRRRPVADPGQPGQVGVAAEDQVGRVRPARFVVATPSPT